ncbi:Mu transposase C-terminal domain-containing protein, partial [Shinella sp.]|uniref:Mu transposase C-terminal domain-containing protein n=1 Tax=Shinella sp. TaxID=1870904 RepID=UPI003F6F9A01
HCRADRMSVDVEFHLDAYKSDEGPAEAISVDVLSTKGRALALRRLAIAGHIDQRVQKGEAILREETLQPILDDLFKDETFRAEMRDIAAAVPTRRAKKSASGGTAEIGRKPSLKPDFHERFMTPPCPRAALGWYRQFIHAGRKAIVLAGDYSTVGRKPRCLSPTVIDLIDEVSRVHQFDGTIISAYHRLEAKVYAHNLRQGQENAARHLSGDSALPLEAAPSLKIFKKAIKLARGPFAEEVRKRGLVAAERRNRPLGTGLIVNTIGERVEMDMWQCNLKIILGYAPLFDLLSPAKQKALQRLKVWLAIAFDCASKNVLGIAFSMTSKADAVLRARAMIGVDKTAVARSAGARCAWTQRTGVYQLISDNGKEFQSVAVHHAEEVLREATKGATPAARPEFKGMCERLFRTIADRYRGQPGFTEKKQSLNPDFDPAAHAQLVLDDLAKLLIGYVVDEYHNNEHRGLPHQTPAMAWAEKSKRGCHPPAPASRRRVAFGVRLERKLGRHGVSVLGIDYQSAELQDHFRKHGAVKVRTYFDPLNLGGVTVQLGNMFYTAKPRRNLRLEGVTAEALAEVQRQLRVRLKEELTATEGIVNASISNSMALFAGTAYRATIALQGWSVDELLTREKALGAQLHIIESASSATGAIDHSGGLAVETYPVGGDDASVNDVPQTNVADTLPGETAASPATPRAKPRRNPPKALAQRAPKTNTRFK